MVKKSEFPPMVVGFEWEACDSERNSCSLDWAVDEDGHSYVQCDACECEVWPVRRLKEEEPTVEDLGPIFVCDIKG